MTSLNSKIMLTILLFAVQFGAPLGRSAGFWQREKPPERTKEREKPPPRPERRDPPRDERRDNKRRPPNLE